MKVLFLARRFYPNTGGVEKHVIEVGLRLIEKGHTVIVITEKTDETLKSKELTSGIQIYRIAIGRDNRSKKIRIWKELKKLNHILQSADVIHCHDVFFWYLPFRFFYPHKPVYTTFHGYESYPVSKKTIAIRKLSEKLSWGNICIGDFIKKWYYTQPTYVSYGGVNTNHGTSKMKVKSESALFYGRLDNLNGIDVYAKAIATIKEKHPKFDFLVIGDGSYKSKLEKDIQILDPQENPERYFQKYRFAFISSYLSILEAMQARRLVFAVYNNPLKEDYLKMTPYAKYIIIVSNEVDLAKKITFYLQHPEEEEKLVNKAYEYVKKQSWDTVVEMYLKLWKG